MAIKGGFLSRRQYACHKKGEVMIIDLKEIPESGSQYHCTQNTKEFNKALEGVLGKTPYEINFKIQPNGNLYTVFGNAKVEMPLTCIRCLGDFSLPISVEIKEFLLMAEELPRTGKEAKVNHTSELIEDGPMTTYLKDLKFDLSPLVYDLIALAAPNHALCGENCKGLCGTCGIDLNKLSCHCPDIRQHGHPGFAKLKELKLN